MKTKISSTVIALAIIFTLTSCSSSILVQNSVPPGQAKKQAGAQSAKEFAPGQQKKAAGEQSAKEFAPGQQKKSVPPGQTKKKN